MKKYFKIITFLLLFYSCTSVKEITIKPFELLYGSGGGFTGLWNGYSINDSGKVFSWLSRYPGKDPKYFTKLEKKDLQRIYKIINDDSLLYLRKHDTSNLVLYISVKSDSIYNEIFWDEYSEGNEKLNLTYDSINTIIKKYKEQ